MRDEGCSPWQDQSCVERNHSLRISLSVVDSTKNKVLLLCPDIHLSESLGKVLEQSGYVVDTVHHELVASLKIGSSACAIATIVLDTNQHSRLDKSVNRVEPLLGGRWSGAKHHLLFVSRGALIDYSPDPDLAFTFC
jgi:hypothetical protein